MSVPRLRLRGVTLAYADHPVVSGLDLELPDGAVTAVIGANASGKSTLLRALARLLVPVSGAVLLDGADIRSLSTREVARRLGLLPQSPPVPEGLTVEELVARGRYPHQGLLQQWSRADETAVERALWLTGTAALRHRRVDHLSGGQRQRVWIALALAQDTPVLLLDEPTTFLDPAQRLEVLSLLRRLNTGQGRTVVMVLHDVNEACRFADQVVALAGGRVVAQGPPAEVVTPALLAEVFGLEADVVTCPHSGAPLCIPLRSLAGPADPAPEHGKERTWQGC